MERDDIELIQRVLSGDETATMNGYQLSAFSSQRLEKRCLI